jgi:hypothetical protein
MKLLRKKHGKMLGLDKDFFGFDLKNTDNESKNKHR